MKLYLVNNYYYIVCYSYADAEMLYRERFNDYGSNAIKSINLISESVLLQNKNESNR